jgi:hypothetical protein
MGMPGSQGEQGLPGPSGAPGPEGLSPLKSPFVSLQAQFLQVKVESKDHLELLVALVTKDLQVKS